MNKLFDYLFDISRRLIGSWVRVEKLELHDLSDAIDPEKPVIYILENQSFSDILVVDRETIQKSLPSIKNRMEIPELGGSRSVLTLNASNSLFRSRRKVENKLISLVKYLNDHPDHDFQLVPVCMLWGRGPKRESSLLKAMLTDAWSATGRIQKLFTILFNGRNTYIEFSQPISLRKLNKEKDSPEKVAAKAARILRIHLRRVKSRVVGPDLSHRRTMVNQLLRTPNVRSAIDSHAKANNVSKERAHQQASKLAQEIAANISFATVRFMDALLTRLWNKIYNGVEVAHVEQVQQLAQTHEIVYAPCHRSHIDYLLLSYCLYYRGLNIPHIAAGINLNFPVVGSILRRCGAFFMRRTFKGNKLYSTIFNEYIHMVFTKGHPVEYFVEGGRSRTGRTLHPKTGMLAMTLKSFLRDNERPIAIIPVYIGYEKVLEERSYIKELNGAKKRKENLFGLFRTAKNLKNFGKVSLNFGDPIHLREHLNLHRPGWKEEEYGSEFRPSWLTPVVDSLAKQLAVNINSAAALNPVNLVSLALLSAPRMALDERTLCSQLNLYVDLIQSCDQAGRVTLPKGKPRDWIDYVVDRNLVKVHELKQLGLIYSLTESKAILMTYYRNNVLHLFALPSLVACLFNNHYTLSKEEVVGRFKKVYPYVKSELFLPWSENQAETIALKWLDQLTEKALLTRVDEKNYCCPSLATKEHAQFELLTQALMPTLERYFLTVSLLVNKGSGYFSAADLELKSQGMAQRQSILNGLNAPEFFDKTLFRNFIQELKDHGIIEMDELGKITFDERLHNVIEDAKEVLRTSITQSSLSLPDLSL